MLVHGSFRDALQPVAGQSAAAPHPSLLLLACNGRQCAGTAYSELTAAVRLQKCDSLPDDPQVIGNLDGDTAVSHHTFSAALSAAGAVCRAVDEVVCGTVSLQLYSGVSAATLLQCKASGRQARPPALRFFAHESVPCSVTRVVSED